MSMSKKALIAAPCLLAASYVAMNEAVAAPERSGLEVWWGALSFGFIIAAVIAVFGAIACYVEGL